MRVGVAGFGLGAVVTVADNGLAYVSVAEVAGREWSGRALGVQNTVQNVAAVATPPALAAVVSGAGYAWGFALVAVFPLVAIPLTPVRSERLPASGRRRPIRGRSRSRESDDPLDGTVTRGVTADAVTRRVTASWRRIWDLNP